MSINSFPKFHYCQSSQVLSCWNNKENNSITPSFYDQYTFIFLFLTQSGILLMISLFAFSFLSHYSKHTVFTKGLGNIAIIHCIMFILMIFILLLTFYTHTHGQLLNMFHSNDDDEDVMLLLQSIHCSLWYQLVKSDRCWAKCYRNAI